jgi:hypothetical protein
MRFLRIRREGGSVGTITVKVSDLTGELIQDEEQVARLMVETHPRFDEPITLEIKSGDIEDQLTRQAEFVGLSYYPPGTNTPQRFIMLIGDFNNLLLEGEMDSLLERLHREQQVKPPSRRGGRRQARRIEAPQSDYSSPDHAGEPHPGIVSGAEREYVRENLDAVNARLREKGMREITPDDSELAERYGLTTEPIVEAEVVEEDPSAG